MASTFDRWIRSLSRNALAALVIAGGIFLIIASDPPRTVCDSQMEVLRKQQAAFLYPDQAAKTDPKGVDFKRLFSYCKAEPGPGACYELFSKLRMLITDIKSVPAECTDTLAAESEVQKALWFPLKLLVEEAWGKQPPAGFGEKTGWLDSVDLALYCNLTTQIARIYGQPSIDEYSQSLFKKLPGAETLPRSEAWEKMLLTIDCRKYL